MSLASLMAAGAEAVATAALSRFAQTGGRRLSQRIIDQTVAAIQRRIGSELRGAELRNARDIVSRAREAQLAAGRLDALGSRPLRPSEIPTAPAAPRNDRTYSYVVVIHTTDLVSGNHDSFTVEVRDRSILTGDEVRGRAIAMAARGEVRADYRSKVVGLNTYRRADAAILTVYQGTPRVN